MNKLPTYSWSLGISGLSYLGLGLGFLVAAFTNVMLQDEIYARLVIADGKIGMWLLKDQDTIRRIMREKRGEFGADEDVEKKGGKLEEGKVESGDAGGRRRGSDGTVSDGVNSAFGNVTPVVNPDLIAAATPTNDTTVSESKQDAFDTSLDTKPTTPSTPSPLPKPSTSAGEPKKGRPEYRLPLCFVGMLILPSASSSSAGPQPTKPTGSFPSSDPFS